jgi:hypothetical protein
MYSADSSKKFIHYLPNQYDGEAKAQLSLSLDIIFHLVEDVVFETYMHLRSLTLNKSRDWR